jgi:hypothetical protein
MPAEEGVGLDNQEGLSPEGRRSGEEKEPDAVLIADLGAFDLALQDDQLLPQEGVLGAMSWALLRTASLAAPASSETASGLSICWTRSPTWWTTLRM